MSALCAAHVRASGCAALAESLRDRSGLLSCAPEQLCEGQIQTRTLSCALEGVHGALSLQGLASAAVGAGATLGLGAAGGFVAALPFLIYDASRSAQECAGDLTYKRAAIRIHNMSLYPNERPLEVDGQAGDGQGRDGALLRQECTELHRFLATRSDAFTQRRLESMRLSMGLGADQAPPQTTMSQILLETMRSGACYRDDAAIAGVCRALVGMGVGAAVGSAAGAAVGVGAGVRAGGVSRAASAAARAGAEGDVPAPRVAASNASEAPAPPSARAPVRPPTDGWPPALGLRTMPEEIRGQLPGYRLVVSPDVELASRTGLKGYIYRIRGAPGDRPASLSVREARDGAFKIEDLSINPGFRRRGIGRALVRAALADKPDIQVIRTSLMLDDNASVVRAGLARHLSTEDAIRASPAYRIRAKLGFSEIIPGSVDDRTFAFSVRRPSAAAAAANDGARVAAGARVAVPAAVTLVIPEGIEALLDDD